MKIFSLFVMLRIMNNYFVFWRTVFEAKWQCVEKSTTMQPMVGGKLSKSEESYPNACKKRAPESVQLKEK